MCLVSSLKDPVIFQPCFHPEEAIFVEEGGGGGGLISFSGGHGFFWLDLKSFARPR